MKAEESVREGIERGCECEPYDEFKPKSCGKPLDYNSFESGHLGRYNDYLGNYGI